MVTRNRSKKFLIILAVLAIATISQAQLSPGELSRVHSHLEGLSNCTKCHILGQKVSSQKCLDCHTEIKQRVSQNKGYHASAEIRGKECVQCHSDHHGRNFQIIRFSKEQFNHQLTGYTLKGAHAKRQCQDCHKPQFIQDPQAKKKKATYLGLPTDCLGCHQDFHQNTLSSNCSGCHGDETFKPAVNFDHARTAFRLNGKHQDVPCLSCHKVITRNGRKYQEFKGIRFDNCVSCHTDVHQGRFGQNCMQCHTEQSFNLIRSSGNFDHAKTNFPLEGRHKTVTCSNCHKTKFTAPSQYDHCSDCHADYHKGQMSRGGITPDCATCHTVEGFSNFIYGLEQHNLSPFPLKGAHAATPCVACHQKPVTMADTVWRFRDIGSRCADCHADIHAGYISEKHYPRQSCESCHQESRWYDVRFDHSTTRFRLEGAHTRPACRACHFKTGTDGKQVQQFRDLPAGCSHCHTDIHAGQFDVNGSAPCERCHGQVTFMPAVLFDHQKTRFPLEGKHREVACTKCHKSVNRNGSSYVLYKIKEFKCEDCHH